MLISFAISVLTCFSATVSTTVKSASTTVAGRTTSPFPTTFSSKRINDSLTTTITSPTENVMLTFTQTCALIKAIQAAFEFEIGTKLEESTMASTARTTTSERTIGPLPTTISLRSTTVPTTRTIRSNDRPIPVRSVRLTCTDRWIRDETVNLHCYIPRSICPGACESLGATFQFQLRRSGQQRFATKCTSPMPATSIASCLFIPGAPGCGCSPETNSSTRYYIVEYNFKANESYRGDWRCYVSTPRSDSLSNKLLSVVNSACGSNFTLKDDDDLLMKKAIDINLKGTHAVIFSVNGLVVGLAFLALAVFIGIMARRLKMPAKRPVVDSSVVQIPTVANTPTSVKDSTMNVTETGSD